MRSASATPSAPSLVLVFVLVLVQAVVTVGHPGAIARHGVADRAGQQDHLPSEEIINTVQIKILDASVALQTARFSVMQDETFRALANAHDNLDEVVAAGVKYIPENLPIVDVDEATLERWQERADEMEIYTKEKQDKSQALLRGNVEDTWDGESKSIVVSRVNEDSEIAVDQHRLGGEMRKTVFREDVAGVPRAITRLPIGEYDAIKREWALQETVRQVKVGGKDVCRTYVPRVIGVKATAHHVFVVSELVEGDISIAGSPSPFELWARRHAGNDVADLTALLQMATAIKCVKAAGFVHRDVKPANFLVSREPPFKVMINDFGLTSKQCQSQHSKYSGFHNCREDTHNRSNSTSVVSSTMCCSSEDLRRVKEFDTTLHSSHWPRGERLSELGPQLDVYSLGICFLQMLDKRFSDAVPFSDHERGSRASAATSVAHHHHQHHRSSSSSLSSPTSSQQRWFLAGNPKLHAQVRRLALEMTSKPYPDIEEVIFRLLQLLRVQRKEMLLESHEQLTELQGEINTFLEEWENQIRQATKMMTNRIDEIEKESFFMRYRWLRWIVNRKAYREVEWLAKQIREKKVIIQTLKTGIEQSLA